MLPRTNQTNEERKRELFYAFSVQANTWLRDSNEHISSKFSSLIALNATILTILFGLSYFLLKEKALVHHIELAMTAFIVALLFFLSAMLCGVISYRPVSFVFVNPSTLIRDLKGKPYEQVVGQIAATVAKQVSDNFASVSERSAGLDLTMFLTAFGFVVLSITVLLAVFP